VPVRTAAEHPEAAGLHASCRISACGGQSELEEFANRCGARRHAMPESKIINGGQLFRGEHDLKALGAKVIHGPSHKVSKVSSLLNMPTCDEFHKSRKNHQLSKKFYKNQLVMLETSLARARSKGKGDGS
jgi:hypothetical protein